MQKRSAMYLKSVDIIEYLGKQTTNANEPKKDGEQALLNSKTCPDNLTIGVSEETEY